MADASGIATGEAMIKEKYEALLGVDTDIREHLPRLFENGRGECLEFGVRHGVSTAALLAGVEQHGGRLTSVDIDRRCGELFDHPQWRFLWGHSTRPDLVSMYGPQSIDTLLIDSEHSEIITADELETWRPKMRPGGIIFLHDTYRFFGGVTAAAVKFCYRQDLRLELLPGSNGLGVIRV